MTRVLIDTQALIWFAEDNPTLSKTAVSLVDNRSTDRLASAASLWEMSIKISLEKLSLRAGTIRQFARLLDANDIEVLPVIADDGIAVADLPAVSGHKDPFDRMIAAQCLRLDLTLVSIDSAFNAYGVRRVW